MVELGQYQTRVRKHGHQVRGDSLMRMKLLIVLEIVGRDEIAMAITYEEAKNMTHSKKEEPPREDAKMDFLQTQGNKLEAHGEEKCNSESSGTTCRRRNTESWVDH